MTNPTPLRQKADHTGFRTLPIVDISNLTSASRDDRMAAAQALGTAAREAGFFYVTGHQVTRALREGLVAQARALFALPIEEKMRWYIGNSGLRHRGYVPEGEEGFYGATVPDRKEAFDLCNEVPESDPDVVAGTPLMGPNVWPEIAGFKHDVSAYYRAAFGLGCTLLKGFALSLGLPGDAFDGFVTKPPSQLRLIHYPFNPDAPADQPGIGTHTDYEIFTILMPTAPGLEVMNGNGEWIDAPPLEDAFVVNIGDMMEIWTNGAFVATSHRVRRVAEERYSFPLFFSADYHARIEPLAPFVSPACPPRYQSLIAGEHLFAQTAQTFSYLKSMIARGELALPDGSHALSSFGQHARHGEIGAQ